MLIEIHSPAFKKDANTERGSIVLHKGLNTIIGGGLNDNGIGKSSFLLAIDFAFGGDEYPRREVVESIHDHTVYWCMEFDGEKFYFARNTGAKDIVWVCNDQFVETFENMPVTEYRKWLLSKYRLHYSDLDFSVITSNFLKIHPKPNGNHIKLPLKAHPSVSHYDSIVLLEKLFDRYDEIAETKTRCQERGKDANALTTAEGRKLLKKITVTQNNKNIEELESLRARLQELNLNKGRSEDTGKRATDEELVKVEHNLALLRAQRRQKIARKAALLPLTEGTETPDFEAEIERLNEFLLRVLDVPKINEIQAFHSEISAILAEEAREDLRIVCEEISELDRQINSLLAVRATFEKPISISPSYFDECVSIELRIKDLESQIDYFNKHKSIKEEAQDLSKTLEEVEPPILKDIQEKLNAELKRLMDLMFGQGVKPSPEIKIKSNKSYTYETTKNASYGCEHRDVILFDIAISNLTGIPVLALDNQIIKATIEDPTIDALFKLFVDCDGNKQYFIAFDGVPKLENPALEQQLNDASVLTFDEEHGRFLYGRDLTQE